MSGELTRIDYLIVGIGVNVNQKQFEQDIEQTATSLSLEAGSQVSRMDLLIQFLSEFEKLYDRFIKENDYLPVLETVRNCSSLLGRQIDVIRGDIRRPAKALQILADGRLEVVYEDGSHEMLSGGEVSVRKSG
jgi:BirA family transcriptional regulator, biotin operon repressor / biotin---[acetyl-CoA-carboxylase] ligase